MNKTRHQQLFEQQILLERELVKLQYDKIKRDIERDLNEIERINNKI